MFKKIIKRILLGFISGVFIGQVFLILNSILSGSGNFIAVDQTLITAYGNSLNGVIVQFFCTGFTGALFAGSSCIFEIENWGLTIQTLVHFLFTSILMFIIALISKWTSFNLKVTAIWFGIFIFVYIIFWICFFTYFKVQIKKLNGIIKKK